ncbi:hypothetical protein [Corynebacterium vitaeruminis]|uniref:hypothetical protein n=1 Tax=Corynebacterium vitaeruminis TaxID=38305 RepID=UPI0023F06BC9|nr:hypothetical protein [Corynebacterium vitaeruminis]
MAYDPEAYGSEHKRNRDVLLYQLLPGTECEVCARPMYRDPTKNFDGAPLEADHENADTSKPANRLIHRTCNRSIVTKWVKHGAGWVEKYGFTRESLSVDGGKVTTW